MAHGNQAAEEHHASVGHVVPLGLLFGVLGALLFLTFVTVAVTRFDLGNLNLIVAMAIAAVKGAFVLLYFMHLRWDRPFNAVVFVSSLAFVALFIILALLDTSQYQPDLIPGHAPAMNR